MHSYGYDTSSAWLVYLIKVIYILLNYNLSCGTVIYTSSLVFTSIAPRLVV